LQGQTAAIKRQCFDFLAINALFFALAHSMAVFSIFFLRNVAEEKLKLITENSGKLLLTVYRSMQP
jgi:hypothetical protein